MAPPKQMALTMERLVRAARISWPTDPTSRNFQLIFKASTLPGYLGTHIGSAANRLFFKRLQIWLCLLLLYVANGKPLKPVLSRLNQPHQLRSSLQIILLLGILVALLMITDKIGTIKSLFFSSITS
ncbi:hypothetical protein C4D60_Mb09t16280 [Musa balbisiana]|uniref:Uncharacterized protein n=1 Tax=Musa balbisiana TaxID=52838 RepID=A0A4S8IGY5_MUSBA|nr:hypothetical protein C4D60_Mb09t16280 [Musa balbisiana]